MSEKYGFVYVWYDRKFKRFYIGSHWGTEDDGYICSSNWMRMSYVRRPQDFKRRIVKRIYTNRKDLLDEEQRWLNMIDCSKININNKTQRYRDDNVRYYNLNLVVNEYWHTFDETRKTVGQKVSAAKKGKATGPCSPEKARKISEAKKRKFAERKATLGYTRSPEQVERHRQSRAGYKHSEEWKKASSERMKHHWASGARKPNGAPLAHLSDDEKQIIYAKRRKTMTGRKLSSEHVASLCLNWIVTSPSGVEHRVSNLNQFCRDMKLTRANIARSSGSKGWKAQKVPE